MDIQELRRRLQLADFFVRDIVNDGSGIAVTLDDHDEKDPSLIIESWMEWVRRPKPLAFINIVTAVSRPTNLTRIYRSMSDALGETPIGVQWTLVFDSPGKTDNNIVEMIVRSPRIKVVKAIYEGGPMTFGIVQKNMGMDLTTEGFYHCLDDDNIVHPQFFIGIFRAIMGNLDKKAFVCGQKRWDDVGDLVAKPENMLPRHIDNTMFVVHKDLIGSDRYEVKYMGGEDHHFFRKLYSKDPGTFVFLDEFLAYYNFLRHFPNK